MRRPCLLLLAAFLMTAVAQVPVAVAATGDELSIGNVASQAPEPIAYPQGDARSGGRAQASDKAPIYSSGYGRAYGMRPGSAFTSGLLGGFLGAGLGGLLFGGGFFQGMHGGPGVLGVLLQLIITYSLAVWLYRRFAVGLAPGGTGLYARIFYPETLARSGAVRPGFFGGGRSGRPITLNDGDFRSFEELLHCMQTAWSAQDLAALRTMTTPEMAEAYARKLSEQQLQGLRNQVTDVRLQQADVSEAWSDGRREFATVALTFSMVDIMKDSSGRVVDGSETERITVRQYWSFNRTARARWIVSAVEEPK